MKNISKNELKSRIKNLKNLNDKIHELLNKIPVKIPEQIKEQIIDKLFEQEELEELVNALKYERPPKLMFIGRTGVGKSSLINAIFKEYMAEISDVEIGTKNTIKYEFKEGGETKLEVLDTRGIGESEIEDKTAEEILKEDINKFKPDAIVFLVRAKDRSRLDKDIKELSEINKLVNDKFPIICVSTQVDELAPSRFVDPNNYPPKKIENINEAENQLRRLLNKYNIEFIDLVSVSSYIEWSFPNIDEPIYNIDKLSKEDKRRLVIKNDFSYNIDDLIDTLANNMELKAKINLLLNLRIDKALDKVSDNLINSFAKVAGGIGATPIPGSDIKILTPLQILMIMLIAYLGGKELDVKTARDFLLSVGGNLALGLGFQQLAKVLNISIPGSGSAVSGSIAYGGTKFIGNVARRYYIEGYNKKELKEFIQNENIKND
ncbi:MAG: GTPase [Bacillota bacterium]